MLHNVVNIKENLKSYLLIAEAAARIGVHPDTLRRWERNGKIRAYRHPVNRYRLYLEADLEQLIEEIQQP